jgi:signal transduction histidine kinase
MSPSRSPAPFFGRFGERLQERLLSFPIPLKIMGMAVGLTCLIGGVTTYRVHHVLTADLNSYLEVESRSLAAEVAEYSREYLLINDPYGLASALKSMAQNRPDLRYAVVLDQHHHVQAHTFDGGFPRGLLARFGGDTNHHSRTERILTNEGIIWESFHPIMQGEEGFVSVGLHANRLAKRNARFIRTLILNTFLVALVGILCSAVLTWLITKPVKNLLQATRRVRQGDYTIEIRPAGHDEVGWLIEAFNEMVSQLQTAELERNEREKMRSDFLQRIITSQENERKRIARELHDQTGQALASFMVAIKMLESTQDCEEGKKGLVSLKAAITREMEAIHHLALDLRPSVLDDMGLIAALELYLNDYRTRYRLAVELVAIGFENRRPDPCIETCIYRIVQEALTNVVRHARADRVSIILEWCPGKIRGIVEDNGIGFEASHAKPVDRLGLYGMEERVLLLAGSFRLESEPGQGTMVIFDIPVSPREEGDDG